MVINRYYMYQILYFFSPKQACMIFIQENAAFIQVLIYQDWHNQLLDMIYSILLLNSKESFLNYFNLGGGGGEEVEFSE